MQDGRLARTKVAELLAAMQHGEDLPWSADRRLLLADGTSLELQLEREPRRFRGAPGHTRAVLLDRDGSVMDATEWWPDPGVRIVGTVPRLRVLVDRYLAAQQRS